MIAQKNGVFVSLTDDTVVIQVPGLHCARKQGTWRWGRAIPYFWTSEHLAAEYREADNDEKKKTV